MGLFHTKKEKPKLDQAAAFERFKESVREAVYEAKRAGVWDWHLGDFLERYATSLGGGR
jgi:hypothetical protein